MPRCPNSDPGERLSVWSDAVVPTTRGWQAGRGADKDVYAPAGLICTSNTSTGPFDPSHMGFAWQRADQSIGLVQQGHDHKPGTAGAP